MQILQIFSKCHRALEVDVFPESRSVYVYEIECLLWVFSVSPSQWRDSLIAVQRRFETGRARIFSETFKETGEYSYQAVNCVKLR